MQDSELIVLSMVTQRGKAATRSEPAWVKRATLVREHLHMQRGFPVLAAQHGEAATESEPASVKPVKPVLEHARQQRELIGRRGSRVGRVLLVGIVGLAAAGCDSGKMKQRHEEDVRRWNEFWDSGGRSLGKEGEAEVWTIECNSYEGPRRKEMGDRMAGALKRVKELRSSDVWVQHDADHSRVFYGNYRLRYVEAQVDSSSHAKGEMVIELNDEIKRDLRFIKELALGDQYPFFSARPTPRPTEDVGPPEWDLRNAKGVYTLQVGVTYPTPALHNYKQAAVEWVKALREQGVEAYYYHSPEKPLSSVCVGTFGADALVDLGDGRTQYSDAVNALRKQGDFAYNLENGQPIYRRAKDTDTGEIEKMPNWSFLVKIPARPETVSEGQEK